MVFIFYFQKEIQNNEIGAKTWTKFDGYIVLMPEPNM